MELHDLRQFRLEQVVALARTCIAIHTLRGGAYQCLCQRASRLLRQLECNAISLASRLCAIEVRGVFDRVQYSHLSSFVTSDIAIYHV